MKSEDLGRLGQRFMKRFSCVISLGILLCIALLPASAEAKGKGTLSGTVLTPEGRTLIGAIITLFKQDDDGAVISLTRSDEDGVYSLRDISPGSYSLRVSRYGYQIINKPDVKITSGETTTLNLILHELLDIISARNDPRNWDLKTVMRTTSDRRLIYRVLPDAGMGDLRRDTFQRNGTLSVASASLLGGDNYAVYPNMGDNGIVSNFAFVEPVSQHGRMIFSGQLTSGYDSLWRVRNTYHYRPDSSHDWKLSVGYGRLNLNRMSAATTARPVEFFSQDPMIRDSGVESLAVGIEATSEFLDTLAVRYGMDLSRIRYGRAKNIWSPYFQIMVKPHHGWLIRTMMSSRRFSENNCVELPDGGMVNLMEPASISKINGEVFISQIRHSEVSVARKISEDASIELSVYRDQVEGPGTPFVVTSTGMNGRESYATQLRGDQDGQEGIRIAVASMLIDSVRGSITYNYSTASNLPIPDDPVTSSYMAAHLLDLVQRSYYHSVTSQLETSIPHTRTHIQASFRWYPGNPISPIDLFADRLDTFTKGMNFVLKQVIPVPEFMGSAGRWEALVDIRNPFDQGRTRILTSDGDFTLTRTPPTLRFGLNLNFF
jgi:hypothetical protein